MCISAVLYTFQLNFAQLLYFTLTKKITHFLLIPLSCVKNKDFVIHLLCGSLTLCTLGEPKISYLTNTRILKLCIYFTGCAIIKQVFCLDVNVYIHYKKSMTHT